MKYISQQLLGQTPQVVWEGFAIPTQSSYGADKLSEELNRLDGEVKRLSNCIRPKVTFFGGSYPKCHEGVTVDGKRYLLESIVEEDLNAQVQAKLTAMKKHDALHQRLGVRTGQVHELLTVLERSQTVLADYLDPATGIKPRAALDHLLDILDDSALITMMNNLRELIGVKYKGSVELTCLQKAHVLQALDETAQLLRNYTSEQPASYAEACRILGASEDGDVANGSQKFPEVGDEATLVLRRGEDGKQYIAGIHFKTDQPFIVQADQVYVNGAEILEHVKSTIGQTELAAELQERVVNNTTNHFGVEPKASKKELKQLKKAVKFFESYAEQEDPLDDNVKAAKHLRKLLKKLS